MRMLLISRLLPAAIVLIQIGVLGILAKRKLRSQFPFFFSYVLFNTISLAALATLFVLDCCVQYAYLYWTLSVLNMCLTFAVLYEIFVNALKPYSALIDLGKMLFFWAALFMLVAATVTALATNGSVITKFLNAMQVVDRSLRLMQCGLLMLVLLFERRLGLSWRNYGMVIALGIGVSGAVDLVVSYAQIHFEAAAANLEILNSVCYLGVVAFWAVCLYLPQPQKKNVLDSPSRLIFQRWNEALMASPLVSRKGEIAALSPVESFLPGVERTVERVMARKMMH